MRVVLQSGRCLVVPSSIELLFEIMRFAFGSLHASIKLYHSLVYSTRLLLSLILVIYMCKLDIIDSQSQQSLDETMLPSLYFDENASDLLNTVLLKSTG